MGDCCGTAAPAWPASATVLRGKDGLDYISFEPEKGEAAFKQRWIMMFNHKDVEGC